MIGLLEKISTINFLSTIITDEFACRNRKKLASALRRTNFRNQKTLKEFDFTFRKHQKIKVNIQ